MNEINLETEKRKLKGLGIILSEQGLFIDIPRIFSVPPNERDFIRRVESKVPATFPILSFDAHREIERNLKKTLTGYSIEVRAWSDLTHVGLEFQQKTVWERNVYVNFGYHVGENNWKGSLLSLRVQEAVILKKYRRLITCDIRWGDRAEQVPDQIVPVATNYVITTINDAETPIYRTNLIKKSQTYDCVRIDAYRHKIYKRKRYESAFSIAKAIATGQVVRKRDITYKGLPLSGVGIHFPLDTTNSFHFIFTGRRR